MVFKEVGKEVLSCITVVFSSGNDNIVLQASSALANMSNGPDEQQDLILSYLNLISALQVCLSEFKGEVRGPAVSCILELVTRNSRRKKAMTEAGIVGSFKRLCEWSSYGYPHRYGGTSGGWDCTTTFSPSTVGVGESFWKWSGGPGSWGG